MPAASPQSVLIAGFLLIFGASLEATDLTWGSGGAGGSGSWSNPTWWDGSSNVSWVSGANAIFSGTSGAVDSYSLGPSVAAITFNTPGYTIQNGTVNVAATSLTVTANANATISSALAGGQSTTFIKNGPARLTVSGANSIPNLQVDAGELVFGSTSSVPAITLGNTTGATVTLAKSGSFVSLGSLSGGGSSGGVFRPDTTPRTLTIALSSGSTFNGVIADNLPGKIGLLLTGSGTTTLGGVNTYSGATEMNGGTLALPGGGSLSSSALSVQGATLRLDNSSGLNANRLSNSAPFVLNGGTLDFIGNPAQPIEETLGALNLKRSSTIRITQPGSAAAQLTFAGLTRTDHATLTLTGAAGVAISGLANQGNGLLPTYLSYGNEWARLNASGRIEAATNYTTDVNAPGGNVKLTGSATLAAPGSQSTLNIQGTGTLDLSENSLALTQGGIITSGGAYAVANGTLGSSAELVITNRTDLAISAGISGTALTKSGAGTLTLSGNNSYTGTTTINEGILLVSSAANLGTGSTIEFGSGTLKAAGSFVSTKNLMASGSNLSLVFFVGLKTIDTNGFDVTFSGTNDGDLFKKGAGTLTLMTAAAGFATIEEGTLALPNASSGTINLLGGTLLAAGNLGQLSLLENAALDIGGEGAATLTNLSLLAGATDVLTIRFGIGSIQSDLWTLSTSNPVFTSPILFDFNDLGGVQTGVTYTLISMPNRGSGPGPSVSPFGFSEESTAAGWSGSFSSTSNSIRIQFTSVPEPASGILVGLTICPLLSARRFGRRWK